MRRVLGVDPGSRKTGFCVLDEESRLLTSGSIVLGDKVDMPLRLYELQCDLLKVIEKHKTNELALETSFFAKNAQSAFKLGQVRGVIMAVAASQSMSVAEYSPTEVKLSVCGSGRADKLQVEHMMRMLLKLPKTFEFSNPDESDAMALCLTHLHKTKSGTWRAHDSSPQRSRSSENSDNLSN